MNVAFVCPGQGSQEVGMGKVLAQRYDIVRSCLSQADDVLNENLSEMMFNGPSEQLTRTIHAQPAILALSVGVGRLLMENGLKPVVIAGHSLGEYTALVLAGSLAFKDAIGLVRVRGQLMEQAIEPGVGNMAAVLGLTDEIVEGVCRGISQAQHVVEPANYNCPGQLVISGHREAVEQAMTELKRVGAKRCVLLNVSAPFHCSLLQPAGQALAKHLEQIDFVKPDMPYIANVDAEIINDSSHIPQRLADQVWHPVRWTQSLQKLVCFKKIDRVLEVGPGRVLAGHVKRVDRNIQCMPTDTVESVEQAVVE